MTVFNQRLIRHGIAMTGVVGAIVSFAVVMVASSSFGTWDWNHLLTVTLPFTVAYIGLGWLVLLAVSLYERGGQIER